MKFQTRPDPDNPDMQITTATPENDALAEHERAEPVGDAFTIVVPPGAIEAAMQNAAEPDADHDASAPPELDAPPPPWTVDQQHLAAITADFAEIARKYGLSIAGVAVEPSNNHKRLVFTAAPGGSCAVMEPGGEECGWAHAGSVAVVPRSSDNAVVVFSRVLRATFNAVHDPEGDAFNAALDRITERVRACQTDGEFRSQADVDPTVTMVPPPPPRARPER